jgi:hypothetical protein
MKTFWNIASCSLVEVDRRFRSAYCLHNQGDSFKALNARLQVPTCIYFVPQHCEAYGITIIRRNCYLKLLSALVRNEACKTNKDVLLFDDIVNFIFPSIRDNPGTESCLIYCGIELQTLRKAETHSRRQTPMMIMA